MSRKKKPKPEREEETSTEATIEAAEMAAQTPHRGATSEVAGGAVPGGPTVEEKPGPGMITKPDSDESDDTESAVDESEDTAKRETVEDAEGSSST